jgi:hypothetical protein
MRGITFCHIKVLVLQLELCCVGGGNTVLPMRRKGHELQAVIASRKRRLARQEPQENIQHPVSGPWIDQEVQGD